MTETQHGRIECLESLVEQQAERLEALEKKLHDDGTAEETTADGTSDDGTSTSTTSRSDLFSRRSLLQAGVVVGLGGYATGAASAAEPRGVIGSAESPVERLYLNELTGPLTDGQGLTTLAGAGLTTEDGALVTEPSGPSVANDGSVVMEETTRLNFRRNIHAIETNGEVQLSARDTNTDTQTDVSDDGSTVVENADTIDFGTNLDVTEFGESVTVDADLSSVANWEDTGTGLLTTAAGFTGIGVTDVQTDTLADDGSGAVTAGSELDLDGHDLTDAGSPIWDASNDHIPQSQLEADSVTVAGNAVSLGGATGVDYTDLSDTGNSFPIPNTDLDQDSVTVAGNAVALGGSTDVDYTDLGDTGSSFPIPNTDLDQDSVTVAGNAVSLGGATGVDYTDLTDTGNSFPIPNADLNQDTVTVAGNAVSLGGSTGVDYTDLTDTGNSFPIPNTDLDQDSVTVTAGDGLKNGGPVSLGDSTVLDVEPADFAGRNLTTNGGDLDFDPPENVIVVAKSGGDYTSVDVALSNASSPDVVWVAPGEYEVSSTNIPSGVSLVGASRTATTLYSNSFRGFEQTGDAELRSLTIEKRSGSSRSIIGKKGESTLLLLQNVRIRTTHTGETTGILHYEGHIRMQNTEVQLDNNNESTGILVNNNGTGTPVLIVRNSSITGGSSSAGLSAQPETTVKIAHSQVVNGFIASGTVSEFGNYDGNYNAL